MDLPWGRETARYRGSLRIPNKMIQRNFQCYAKINQEHTYLHLCYPSNYIWL